MRFWDRWIRWDSDGIVYTSFIWCQLTFILYLFSLGLAASVEARSGLVGVRTLAARNVDQLFIPGRGGKETVIGELKAVCLYYTRFFVLQEANSTDREQNPKPGIQLCTTVLQCLTITT